MMPSFLIIGAPRCGTTVLYEGLKRHPEVYMSPVKEPLFFCSGGMDQLEDYRELFAGATTETMIGEASTLYLYSPEAPARIARCLPGVKLVAILRNPVDRAYSHFLQHVRARYHEHMSFVSALEAEGRWMQEGRSPLFYYRDVGFYGRQLDRYLSVFDQSQMRVWLYEDIQTDLAEVFRAVFEFLGVDDTFPVDTSVRYNPSGVPKNRRLHKLVMGPSIVKTLLKRILPEELQRLLILRVHSLNLTKPPVSEEIKK